MRVVVVFLMLVFGGAVAQAYPRDGYPGLGDYVGTWTNVEVQRNLIVRIVIRPAEYGEGVRVIVYGLHAGAPCVFGEYRGRLFYAKYPKERDQDNSAILVRVDREFVRGHVLIRFNGRGELVTHAVLSTEEHGDIYNVARFAASGPDDDYRGPRRPYYRGY